MKISKLKGVKIISKSEQKLVITGGMDSVGFVMCLDLCRYLYGYGGGYLRCEFRCRDSYL